MVMPVVISMVKRDMMNTDKRIELTKSVIENITCEEGKPFIYVMDSVLGGFGIRVTPKDNKQYVIRFQYNGKRISKSFAPADKLSVTAAHNRAKSLMSEYVLGKEPFRRATSLLYRPYMSCGKNGLKTGKLYGRPSKQ